MTQPNFYEKGSGFFGGDVAIAGNLTLNGTSVLGGAGVVTTLVASSTSHLEGAVTADAAVSVGTTLTVTGAATHSSTSHFVGAVTADAAVSVGTTLAVTGLASLSGGIKRTLSAKTADYPMVVTDDVILVGANSKVMTLPSAVTAGAGRTMTIKNKNFTGTTVKSASGTVDDVAAATGDTASLASAYAKVSYISDGTNWWSL